MEGGSSKFGIFLTKRKDVNYLVLVRASYLNSLLLFSYCFLFLVNCFL